MDSNEDGDFDALLRNSSLGGSAARRLRERTPLSRAHAVRRITELRSQVTRCGGEPEETARAARQLLRLLEAMGYHSHDEVPDELREAALSRPSVPRAVTDQEHVALTEIELCGDLIMAAASEPGERLSWDRIDEVLRVRNDENDQAAPSTAHSEGTDRAQTTRR
jgi:hypothetical protein